MRQEVNLAVYPPSVENPSIPEAETSGDLSVVSELARAVIDNVEQVIVGKRPVIELLLVALLCEGHVLIEDVPGVGKTTLARAIARSIGGEFHRIQFTPDLLPSDISGLSFFDQKLGDFRFRPGPVFANVVLADEINRATPRTQSALLEAMEERTVTVEGETMPLPRPFLVLATENPIELEGTFPLPEAQLDRFLVRTAVGYPSEEDEVEMLDRLQGGSLLDQLHDVTSTDALVEAGQKTRDVFVAPDLKAYVAAMVRATRTHDAVELGASPRGSLGLMRAAQARAAMHGRPMVLPDDVKVMAIPVLGHRLLISPEARLRGRTVDQVLAEIIERIPAPVEGTVGLNRSGLEEA
jgi:MoxR-like ATPase